MATRCQSLRSEFRLRNFLLQFQERQCYSIPQWPAMSPSCFVVYRAVVTTLLIGWPLADLLTEARRFYGDQYTLWFLFATNWSLLLLVLTAVVLTLAAALHLWRTRKHSEDNVSVLAVTIYGFLHISAANCAIVVSLSYWIYIIYTHNAAFFLTPMSQAKHTLNSVFVVCDLLISAAPIRLLHFVYPMLLAVIYALFNFVNFVRANRGPDGEIFPYREMDWHRNTTLCLVATAAILALIVIAQVCLYSVFRLRMWLAGVCVCDISSEKCDVTGDKVTRDDFDLMIGKARVLPFVAKTMPATANEKPLLSNGHCRTHSGQRGVVPIDECQPVTVVIK